MFIVTMNHTGGTGSCWLVGIAGEFFMFLTIFGDF